MDRYNFRKLKHKGYISHKASVTDLEKECFYATPYKNGSAKMPTSVIELKKKQYYAWYEGRVQRKTKVKSKSCWNSNANK